uniref:Uncharacterized protein n=1 Tax=Toxoplasma gondii TgCATBr9 TaxID=943120 RepID=A0A2T6IS41_TOXGO|nr:hypothetical protein TGBR9_209530 [Toxoplasma gondii TgCATBr9]
MFTESRVTLLSLRVHSAIQESQRVNSDPEKGDRREKNRRRKEDSSPTEGAARLSTSPVLSSSLDSELRLDLQAVRRKEDAEDQQEEREARKREAEQEGEEEQQRGDEEDDERERELEAEREREQDGEGQEREGGAYRLTRRDALKKLQDLRSYASKSRRALWGSGALLLVWAVTFQVLCASNAAWSEFFRLPCPPPFLSCLPRVCTPSSLPYSPSVGCASIASPSSSSFGNVPPSLTPASVSPSGFPALVVDSTSLSSSASSPPFPSSSSSAFPLSASASLRRAASPGASLQLRDYREAARARADEG